MGTGFTPGLREPHTTRVCLCLSVSLSGGLRAALGGTGFPRVAGSASTCSPSPGWAGWKWEGEEGTSRAKIQPIRSLQ